MDARFIVTIVVLATAAIGSWYLAQTFSDPEITPVISETGADGFYLRSARILGTDQEGRLLYEIEAEYAEQQENREIEMQNVRVR